MRWTPSRVGSGVGLKVQVSEGSGARGFGNSRAENSAIVFTEAEQVVLVFRSFVLRAVLLYDLVCRCYALNDGAGNDLALRRDEEEELREGKLLRRERSRRKFRVDRFQYVLELRRVVDQSRSFV